VPEDGNETKLVKETLAKLVIEDFDEDDLLKVERRGKTEEKLGSVFVKLSDEAFKKTIMKTKHELKNSTDAKSKKLKIVNFKNPELILLENALREVLSVIPNGNQYELNGSMKLVTK